MRRRLRPPPPLSLSPSPNLRLRPIRLPIAGLKAQLKAELLSEIRAELSSEVKTAVSKEADKPSRLTVGGYGEAVMTRNFFSDNYLRYISPDKVQE